VILTPAPLPGAFVVEVEPVRDERGLFARTFAAEEWERAGLDPAVVQCSVSANDRAGTLRGMHYQAAPFEESKLVRVTRGAIHDVLVDLRPASPTYCRWFAAELTADNRRALHVPPGVAHGFLTLVDGSEVSYQISQRYSPAHARGVRWDDPAFGIEWPAAPRVISERDRTYPDFAPDPPGHGATTPRAPQAPGYGAAAPATGAPRSAMQRRSRWQT
jgi:dTDP-4-dehydrorhamnose 3,5-epimerase